MICGHIPHATIRDSSGVTDIDTGDFVESCTVVAEHDHGKLEAIRWLNLGPPGRIDAGLAAQTDSAKEAKAAA